MSSMKKKASPTPERTEGEESIVLWLVVVLIASIGVSVGYIFNKRLSVLEDQIHKIDTVSYEDYPKTTKFNRMARNNWRFITTKKASVNWESEYYEA